MPVSRRSGDLVSIHAPLARSNEDISSLRKIRRLFQYMLLLRGATNLQSMLAGVAEVSIHAPLARSNFGARKAGGYEHVSIHAPLARSNRGVTCPLSDVSVSIHAPLARSNRVEIRDGQRFRRFNTCSSCEEQLSGLRRFLTSRMFQYMLLLRGATRA